MANNQILKQRKQTYPFKTIQVGDSFTIKNAKYNSMLTAWRYHNKNFTPIKIKAEKDNSNYKITRTE